MSGHNERVHQRREGRLTLPLVLGRPARLLVKLLSNPIQKLSQAVVGRLGGHNAAMRVVHGSGCQTILAVEILRNNCA